MATYRPLASSVLSFQPVDHGGRHGRMREHVSKRTSYRPLQFEKPCRAAPRHETTRIAKLSGSWTDTVRDGRAVPIRNARPLPSYILEQVMTEQQLREKLRKITALF